VNRIFGSIKSCQLITAHTLQQQGIGIIVNRNFFATRLLLSAGPLARERDFDHKSYSDKEPNLRNVCKEK
jgi:hypothetical protein